MTWAIAQLIQNCKEVVKKIEKVEAKEYTPEKWMRNKLTPRGHYADK